VEKSVSGTRREDTVMVEAVRVDPNRVDTIALFAFNDERMIVEV
jgi:hypothetical protein